MGRDKIKGLILEYPDGDLTEPELALVESSLKGSSRYAEIHEKSQKLWSLLESSEELTPTGNYITKFWNSASMEEEKGSRSIWGFLNIFADFPRKWASVAALSVVVVISAFTLNIFDANSPNDVILAEEELQKQTELIIDIERTMLDEPTNALEIYGPWEEEYKTYGGDFEREYYYRYNDLVRPVDFGNIY